MTAMKSCQPRFLIEKCQADEVEREIRSCDRGDDVGGDGNSLLFGPLVLATNLILLLGRKVILDIERFPDLLGRLALDHVGHGLASDIQQGLDIEIIGRLHIITTAPRGQDPVRYRTTRMTG